MSDGNTEGTPDVTSGDSVETTRQRLPSRQSGIEDEDIVHTFRKLKERTLQNFIFNVVVYI